MACRLFVEAALFILGIVDTAALNTLSLPIARKPHSTKDIVAEEMGSISDLYHKSPLQFLLSLADVLQFQKQSIVAAQTMGHMLRRKQTALLAYSGQVEAVTYPWEPLLDDDLIIDANNYLEEFINASGIVSDARATHKAAQPQPSALLHSLVHSQINGSKVAVDTPDVQVAAHSNFTTFDGQPGCRTTQANYSLGGSSRLASEGEMCMFGLADSDEDSHCVYSDPMRYPFGWCYTQQDRSKWGLCTVDCVFHGDQNAMALSEQSDRLRQAVTSALAKLLRKNV